MTFEQVFDLADEAATVAFGERLGELIQAPLCVYLLGDLGAGKTTLSRGILRAFGHHGVVKSPTYTLLESYETVHAMIHHMDLYRLSDPEELEFLGYRDLLEQQPIFLIEWPSHGEGWLSPADLTLSLHYHDSGRQITIKTHDKKLLEKLPNSSTL